MLFGFCNEIDSIRQRLLAKVAMSMRSRCSTFGKKSSGPVRLISATHLDGGGNIAGTEFYVVRSKARKGTALLVGAQMRQQVVMTDCNAAAT